MAIKYTETIHRIAHNIKYCVTPESTIEWIKQQLLHAYEFGYADGVEEQLSKREQDLNNIEEIIKNYNREASIILQNGE